ncbi:phage baseplate protein, partial [Singulisphaera rosea]
RVMEHPVETGVVLADHHIINPVEIDLPLIVSARDYAQTFSQIRQAFINATALSVKTRVGIYSDMIIADMPHEEEPDMYDVITIGLRLKQVIYVVPVANGGTLVNFQPADPLNSDTTASGLQSAAALAGNVLSAATSVASYANLGKFP